MDEPSETGGAQIVGEEILDLGIRFPCVAAGAGADFVHELVGATAGQREDMVDFHLFQGDGAAAVNTVTGSFLPQAFLLGEFSFHNLKNGFVIIRNAVLLEQHGGR